MKKVLIENLWLMAIGWCLYLNDHILASAAIMCFAALYSLYVIGEVDVLRCAVTFIGIYILTLCLYLAGNIPYFFPSLHTFGAMIAFDAAILQELMYKIRDELMDSLKPKDEDSQPSQAPADIPGVSDQTESIVTVT